MADSALALGLVPAPDLGGFTLVLLVAIIDLDITDVLLLPLSLVLLPFEALGKAEDVVDLEPFPFGLLLPFLDEAAGFEPLGLGEPGPF